MPVLDDILNTELAALEQAGRRRLLPYSVRETDTKISFASNDYLGLSQHPAVKEAAIHAIETYGMGAGASRLVTGNHPLYAELEALLAEMKGHEAACVFASGFAANQGVITALMGKDDVVLFDRLAHASLIDGVMLSGATWLRFKHNDVEDCARLLAASRSKYRRCLIITETVFSMDGDRAPVEELAALTEKYDAWMLTDDAHGLGLSMGQEARAGALKSILQTGTLSKSAGALGGYVCGSRTLIEYLHSASRPLIYSTALPPAVLAAAITALKITRQDDGLRAAPLRHAQFFCSQLGLPAPYSAIVPLILGEEARVLDAAQRLQEAGFIVSAIRPPTVPPGTSRLRFTFSALHREEDIERLCALVRVAGWHKRSVAA